MDDKSTLPFLQRYGKERFTQNVIKRGRPRGEGRKARGQDDFRYNEKPLPLWVTQGGIVPLKSYQS